jgi:GNAT superfamily N-acetyltransferase
MKDLQIRLAEETDLPTLSRVYAKAYKVFDVGERWTDESALRLLKHWFKKQPDLFFTAFYKDRVAGGFVAAILPWWDGNHLVDGELFVHPDFQKLGIGTELCKALYRKALEEYGVTSFDTTTFKKSEFPLSWYKSHGFKEHKDWILITGEVKELLDNLSKNKS